jgi:hypothetical protein
MSKYDLPAKTNIKICVCFLWVPNFIGNSMGNDGLEHNGTFDPQQLTIPYLNKMSHNL